MSDDHRSAARSRRMPGHMAAPVVVFAAYSVARVTALLWAVAGGRSPATLLAWADAVGALAAAAQGLTAALLLARPALRRPALAWSIAALTLGATTLDAAVWVAAGSGPVTSRARDLILAIAFATGIMIRTGWRPRWALHATGTVNWAQPRRALTILACGTAAVAIVAAVTRVASPDPARVWHRASDLLLGAGILTSLVSLLAIALVAGEQRRKITDELHHRLAQSQRSHHNHR